MTDNTTATQQHICTTCYDNFINTARYQLGYSTCLPCGDLQAKQKAAKRTIAPINKSNYMFITDPEQLKQLNPKRTT